MKILFLLYSITTWLSLKGRFRTIKYVRDFSKFPQWFQWTLFCPVLPLSVKKKLSLMTVRIRQFRQVLNCFNGETKSPVLLLRLVACTFTLHWSRFLILIYYCHWSSMRFIYFACLFLQLQLSLISFCHVARTEDIVDWCCEMYDNQIKQFLKM